jgi:hypothetical protein
MLNNNDVIQKNIQATKVTGRDDNSQTTNNFYPTPFRCSPDLILKKLLDEHESNKILDDSYREFSDELNNFFKQKTEKKIRDLSEKLIDGNRDYLIENAIHSKERVTRKIQKYILYRSAQDIYTYLLTNIRTAFKHTIEGKIKSHDFKNYEIDTLVKNELIDPFFITVQGSSLCIDIDELYGILYLLTGNCHIDWD